MGKTIFITGVAGFIGYHLAKTIVAEDASTKIIGIDNLNDYYDVRIKKARLSELEQYENFIFIEEDITNTSVLDNIVRDYPNIELIYHLAAQAGVRSSLTQPFKYVQSNLVGQVCIMEFAKKLTKLSRVVYASSSSVYGSSDVTPFSEKNTLSTPFSLYAATKQSDEIICATYSRLLDLPMVGLRFFTAYGSYGRPDMAIFMIAKALLDGGTVELVSNGEVTRDFTHITDIIQGVMRSSEYDIPKNNYGVCHDVINLGTGQRTSINELTTILADKLSIKPSINYVPMNITDMQTTLADISKAKNLLGYMPQISLQDGLDEFLSWFVEFYKITRQ